MFRSRLGHRSRPVDPSILIGNQKGGVVMAWPLPPLGTLFAASQFPLSLTADGILGFVASSVNAGGRPAQTGAFVRFGEIQRVSARGKKVLVNDRLLVEAPSGVAALAIAARLKQFKDLPPKERARAIEQMLRDSLDATKARARWEELQKPLARIRLLTNSVFAFLFVIVPALIWRFGLSLTWPGLLAVLLLLTTATAISFWRAHKRFYPAAEDERFTHFLTILLSPATTIRACDVLTRPLLEAFHPLAVAREFCAPKVFENLSRRILRELRHPALPHSPHGNPAAAAVEREYRELLLKIAEEFLTKQQLKPDALLQAPRAEDGCRSYCPRCLAQFTSDSGVCEDCGGLPLLRLPASC
jgi:hypothetical protein